MPLMSLAALMLLANSAPLVVRSAVFGALDYEL